MKGGRLVIDTASHITHMRGRCGILVVDHVKLIPKHPTLLVIIFEQGLV
jgi:hypothetical protein